MIQQYLTFTLDNTTYAINVFQIQEVLEYEEPQVIPCSSPLLLGIIRSRNSNIAIIDIRKKFGLAPHFVDSLTRTVVLEITDQEQGVINLFGLIADKVLEVVEFDDSLCEKLPRNSNYSGAEFVTSVVSVNSNYVLILDVNKLFSEKELNQITDSTKEKKKRASSKTKNKGQKNDELNQE